MMLLIAIACLLAGATIGALTAAVCAAAGQADDASESALKAQGNQIRQCGDALVGCGQRLIDASDPQQRADFVKVLEQLYPRRGEL